MIDFWDSFMRMVSALALVLALIGGLVYVIRRFTGTRLGAPLSGQVIQVLASGYIGPRKTISLVSVAGEFFAVGMTQTELVSLGHITDRERVQQFLSASTSGQPVAPGMSASHNVAQGAVHDRTAETRGGHVD